ncbi:MAG: nitroreductase family protein, partial [Sphingomonadaceae bacterium]
MSATHDRLNDIRLVPPSGHGLDADFSDASMVLLNLLQQRHSSRAYAARPLPLYTLSRLLWAAFGVNRPAEGGRTAPSARNEQEITLYAVLPEGSYVFEPADLVLRQVSSADLRAATGLQDFVGSAALNLVYVATLVPEADINEQEQQFYAALDTGFI